MSQIVAYNYIVTDNSEIFRLLMLMLLLLNDRDGGNVTGTLNTMMIMAFLAGGSNCGNLNSGGNTGTSNSSLFPDS